MTDVAALGITVTADTGNTVDAMTAVSAAGDKAATSLGNVVEATSKVAPSATAAAASFNQTAASMSTWQTAATASSQGLAAVTAALGLGKNKLDEFGEANVGAVEKGALMIAHIQRLASALQGGSLNARETYVAIKLLGEGMEAAQSTTGGFGGALGSLTGFLGLSATAILGVSVAAAAAVGGLLYLADQAETLDTAIGNLAIGVDKGMGLTAEGFRSAAAAAASAAGISNSAAQEIGQSLAKAGVMGDEGMQKAIVAVTKFAALTGTTAADALKIYSAALKDPLAGLEELNKAYQVTDEAETERIAGLVALNQTMAAAKAIQEDYAKAVKDASTEASAMTTVWNAIKNGADLAGEAISQHLIVTGQDIEGWHQQAKAIQAVVQALAGFGTSIGTTGEKELLLAAGAIDAGKALAEAFSQEKANKIKEMNDTVQKATDEYGKQANQLAKLQGYAKAFQDTVASGIPLTDKQAMAYALSTEALDKLTTHMDAQKKALADLGGDARFLDQVTKAYEDLAQKQEMAGSAAQAFIQDATAEAAVLDKNASAAQGLATAVAALNNPQRALNEAQIAATKIVDDYMTASQGLANAQAALDNPMVAATNALEAQTAAINANLSAKKALANVQALAESPLRAETEAISAKTAALNKEMAASQALANAIAWLNDKNRAQAEAQNAAAKVVTDYTDASQHLANAEAALHSPMTAATNAIEAQAKAIDKNLNAHKALANALAELRSPLREDTQATNAQAAAVNALLAAQQKLADVSARFANSQTGALTAMEQETEATNAAASVQEKYIAASQALADAEAALVSPLTAKTQAMTAAAKVINDNLAATQALADVETALASPLTQETIAIEAQTAVLNANLSAQKALAVAKATLSFLNEKIHSETVAITAQTSVLQGQITAEQNLATAKAIRASEGKAAMEQATAETQALNKLTAAEIGLKEAQYELSSGIGQTIAQLRAQTAEVLKNAEAWGTDASAQSSANSGGGSVATAGASVSHGSMPTTTYDPNRKTYGDDMIAAQTAALSTFQDSMTGIVATFTDAVDSAAKTLADAQTSAAATYAAAMASAQETEVKALQAIKAPTRSAAPDYSSAGATVAQQPGAFGSDKNASTFYDPNSRTAYAAQFGIQGDESSQKATQAYNLQEQQYRTDVASYQLAQATLAQLGSVGADVTTGLTAVQTIIKAANDNELKAVEAQTATLAAAFAASNAAKQTAAATMVSATNSGSDTIQSAMTASQKPLADAQAKFDAETVAMRVAWGSLASLAMQGRERPSANSVTGAADGGDFMVKGAAGRDANLVSLALTAGELVSVKTPAQQGAGGGHTFNMTINTPDANSFQKSRGAIVARMSQMVQTATRNRAAAS